MNCGTGIGRMVYRRGLSIKVLKEWKVEKSKETVVIVRCGLRRARTRKEEQVILQGWGEETVSMFPSKREGPVKRKDTVIVLGRGQAKVF